MRRGHDVTLLATSERSVFSFQTGCADGLRMLRSPDLTWGRLRTGWDPWNVVRRVCRLGAERFDVIHSIDTRPVCIIPALAVQKKSPATVLVLDWGDWWGHGGTIYERNGNLADRLFAPVETFFEEHFRKRADASLTLTTALRARAIALGVPAASVLTMPHGADVEGVKPRPRLPARQALGLEPGRPVIGYVGLLFRRDAQLLLEAFGLLLDRVPRVQMLVIGNSDMRVPANWLASGSVKVTGTLSYDGLQAHIAACDLMVLPMRNSLANRGRWPSKVCDYLASGRAVVTTRVGDVAELLERAQCGILTEDTPEAFAAAIQAGLTDREAADAMGAKGRNIAAQELDWSILTERLERFYTGARAAKASGATFHAEP